MDYPLDDRHMATDYNLNFTFFNNYFLHSYIFIGGNASMWQQIIIYKVEMKIL